MRALTKWLALPLLTALPWFPANAQEALVTDISQHMISIQSNFTGAELLLFGAVGVGPSEERDIVIVVRGPDTPVVVRRKERIGGIWVNYGSAEIENVPGYYAVVSTGPLEAIAPPAVLERYGIGIKYLGFRSPEPEEVPIAASYTEATNRIRTRFPSPSP